MKKKAKKKPQNKKTNKKTNKKPPKKRYPLHPKARRKKDTIRDKIDRIKERVPYIEPSGECIDPDTGEVLFRYTEAQKVNFITDSILFSPCFRM